MNGNPITSLRLPPRPFPVGLPKTDSPGSCSTDSDRLTPDMALDGDCEGFVGLKTLKNSDFFPTKHALNGCMSMSQQLVNH